MGQFIWGVYLLKSNEGVQRIVPTGWYMWRSVIAKTILTVRRTSRAGVRAGYSDPLTTEFKGKCTTDKRYDRDNRLVTVESSYRHRGSAPRCRLNSSSW